MNDDLLCKLIWNHGQNLSKVIFSLMNTKEFLDCRKKFMIPELLHVRSAISLKLDSEITHRYENE